MIISINLMLGASGLSGVSGASGVWEAFLTPTLGFFMFDPRYFIIVGPAMLLAFWAQMKVKSAINKGHQFRSHQNLSGKETAEAILAATGLAGRVRIERAQGFLGDHYDPRAKALRLSKEIYDGRTLSAQGVAAHEVGHALQDFKGYGPLVIRNGLVPLASAGGSISMFILMAGLLMQASGLILLGVILFSATVLFQIVNLPVEFNASSRARRVLLDLGLVTESDDKEIGRVLNAAAMTYVAATAVAIANLLYYVMMFLGSRDQE